MFFFSMDICCAEDKTGLENNDDSVAPDYLHCLSIPRTNEICQKSAEH